jgi:hypothetical protein
MVTPLVGALGVAEVQGDLFVRDVNGDLERLPKGAEEQVLITRIGAVGPSGTIIDLAWEDINKLSRASIMADATDAVFKRVDLGGGAIPNPQSRTRGTHAVLSYDDTMIQGIPWQRFMPQIYSGDPLTLNIYWAAITAIAGDVIWAAAFERDSEVVPTNVDTDSFAALQTAAASTAPGTLGDITKATIAFTQAQADGILAGEPMRLFIQRTADAGGDTMVGDAQLIRAVLVEDAA